MDIINSAVSILQICIQLIQMAQQISAADLIPIFQVGVGSAMSTDGADSIVISKLLTTALTFLAGLALIFGVTLALVARQFYTKSDPKVEKVEEHLAHAHCGACGFPGCHQYAEAVVKNPDVSPSLCTPAGKAAAVKIAALVGKDMGEQEPKIAFVACRGDTEMSKKKFEHRGVPDCVAAAAVAGGDKECPFGCLGYGSCEAACPFDAIKINKSNLPEVDPKKCVSCGLCVKACPRKIISLRPKNAKPIVKCYSHDKGVTVKRYCKTGCITCGLCVKNCPSEAITMVDNLAVIDPKKCTDCGICEGKCPTKAITRMVI
jgi:Na+-translocating ferredoxin:NAD+ oxidoreductase RNF subunit RnfB